MLRQLLPATPRELLVPRQPSSSGLEPTQFLYFDYFRHEMAPRLDGHVESLGDFWLRIVLREGMRDSCVRDAIVSIGALGLARNSESTTAPLFVPSSSPRGLTPHHRTAIHNYINAIARFRSRFTDPDIHLESRSILIITILLAVFEVIQGNTQGVSAITANGLRLLRKQLVRLSASPSGRSPIAASIDDEAITDAVSFLARLATLSQGSETLDNDISIFPPLLFSDALEPLDLECPLGSFISTWFLQLYIISLWQHRIDRAITRGDPVYTDIETQKEHRVLTSRAKAWIEAMEYRLLKETRPSYRRSLKLSCAAAKNIFLFLACALEPDGMAWDNNKDACMEVIKLYREFIWDSMSSHWEANVEYGGYITGLSHMARACCDYEVRQETRAICRELADAQWSWDVKGLMMSTSALIDIDELSRNQNGCIPVGSRYACTRTSWNDNYTELAVTLTPVSKVTDLEPISLTLFPEDFGLTRERKKPGFIRI